MDHLTKEKRSWNMGRIRSNNTSPELTVRSFLFRHGFRFRLHVKTLPGHPDIVLKKYMTVIDVRGCFWHRHAGCVKTATPSTNQDYWQNKFQSNVERDRKNELMLKELGWRVIVIWECEISEERLSEVCLQIKANRG